ncbi:MAG: hypothetical protein J6V66_04965 [Clostridia bacterium]|nr:hypothetical protein [Clostridia bacterium]
MKIKILGSGGGESFPAPFCSCAHCEEARRLGGKNLRTLSQTLINDDLLIDFPADTNCHAIKYGINLGNVENAIITHVHEDHFVPIVAFTHNSVQAHNLKYKNFNFYGAKNVKEKCQALFDLYGASNEAKQSVCFYEFEPYKKQKVGRYEVIALKAMHAPYLDSLNYVLFDGSKSLLYLVDSGYPNEETLEFLEKLNVKFNAVIMDSTYGLAKSRASKYHMSFIDNIVLKQELIRRKIADKFTKFTVTHLTHNITESHSKTKKIFAGTGIDVAFDGYEIEV